MKTYGMGLLKNKNVKNITDADLATIQLNIENQIKQENRLGSKTESFLRNRQKFLKNIDELAGPKGAQVSETLNNSFCKFVSRAWGCTDIFGQKLASGYD